MGLLVVLLFRRPVVDAGIVRWDLPPLSGMGLPLCNADGGVVVFLRVHGLQYGARAWQQLLMMLRYYRANRTFARGTSVAELECTMLCDKIRKKICFGIHCIYLPRLRLPWPRTFVMT